MGLIAASILQTSSAETLFRRGQKINQLLIAESFNNAFAENNGNQTMLA